MSDVVIERDGRVLIATMDRSAHRGSIGGHLMAELLEASRTVQQDDTLGALVVAANGPVWSSGGDPSSLQSGFGPGADASHLVHREKIGGEMGVGDLSDQAIKFDALGVGAWLTAYLECEKPLIAAIDGVAVGGGFALALAHDVRVISERARFLPAFNGLGVGPELGTSWALARLVNPSQAASIIMTNTWVDADEALASGLANLSVTSADLLATAVDYGSRISARPLPQVIAAIRALREASSRTLEQRLALEWHARRASGGPA